MRIDEIELEVIKDYFKGLKRYRGIYYVTLRALVAQEIRKYKWYNFSYREIAEIVLSDPTKTAETQYYCKNFVFNKEAVQKLGNWRTWVISGEYPLTDYYSEKEVYVFMDESRIVNLNKHKIYRATSNEANRVAKLKAHDQRKAINKLRKPLSI